MKIVELGKLMKTVRKKRKIGQVKWAKLLKTSQANISKIESGAYGMSLETFLEFKRVLGKDHAAKINRFLDGKR